MAWVYLEMFTMTKAQNTQKYTNIKYKTSQDLKQPNGLAHLEIFTETKAQLRKISKGKIRVKSRFEQRNGLGVLRNVHNDKSSNTQIQMRDESGSETTKWSGALWEPRAQISPKQDFREITLCFSFIPGALAWPPRKFFEFRFKCCHSNNYNKSPDNMPHRLKMYKLSFHWIQQPPWLF